MAMDRRKLLTAGAGTALAPLALALPALPALAEPAIVFGNLTVKTNGLSFNGQRVFIQDKAPEGAEDAVWFDTGNNNQPHKWIDTDWVPLMPVAAPPPIERSLILLKAHSGAGKTTTARMLTRDMRTLWFSPDLGGEPLSAEAIRRTDARALVVEWSPGEYPSLKTMREIADKRFDRIVFTYQAHRHDDHDPEYLGRVFAGRRRFLEPLSMTMDIVHEIGAFAVLANHRLPALAGIEMVKAEHGGFIVT